MESERDRLVVSLEAKIEPPVADELIEAVARAVALTRVEAADRLIDVPGGARVPAGTIVEWFDLDAFVDGAQCDGAPPAEAGTLVE